MTDPALPATYRYVSDGGMAAALDRDSMARVNRPVVWATLTVVGFGVGYYASFHGNRNSLPYYRGEVVRIALVSGLVVAALLAAAVLVGLALARPINRRRMRRSFPTGSVTEVRLEQDALVIARPAATRTIPYGRIHRVRLREHTQWIVVRGRPSIEVLPAGLLPPDAIGTVRARAAGAVPLSWSPAPTGSVRQVVVPEGWPSHVAAATLKEIARGARFYVRVVLAVLVSALIAYAAGGAWLLLGPSLTLLALTTAFVRTRRAMADAMPSGAVASVEVLSDRMVSRTVRWAREIRFDEIREVRVRGDVVFLAMTSTPPLLALARELVPDAVIERLRAG
ncbi:hypothetical protein ACVW00_001774 [Marmoricola sp. URHA0025 HA25]